MYPTPAASFQGPRSPFLEGVVVRVPVALQDGFQGGREGSPKRLLPSQALRVALRDQEGVQAPGVEEEVLDAAQRGGGEEAELPFAGPAPGKFQHRPGVVAPQPLRLIHGLHPPRPAATTTA